ncbi:MSP domain protein [Trichostrongylus colubriformis]|uniref:MSP domain protein n=1 Tax=Trichostrongylus colubriformis TaxID=6319 RepID=A0AAN8G5P4_TRICO
MYLQSLRITSTMPVRIGFKIQCTDTNLYLFRPVFGIIEPKETFRIKVTRSPHPKKRDKMIVCTTIVREQKESQLPSLFLKKGLPITELCVPLTCH